MRVLYDSQIFTMQRFGGISRYFYELARNSGAGFTCTVSGKYSDNIYAGEISGMRPFPLRPYFRGKWRLMRIFNKSADKENIISGNFDIFHPTYYMPALIPDGHPVVVTVHDMIHEIYPECFAADKTTVPSKRECLKRAARLIAVSERTKFDILKFYPETDGEKIEVVYHGIEWKSGERHTFSDSVSGILGGRKYILFTGQRGVYKNFINFAKAVAPLLLKYDLSLVCTGSAFQEAENALLESLHIKDRTLNFFATENDLKALYENALCFVFPSRYEGFGLPILEAFASECPAVLARASCFPEIAGDAAEYFDPQSRADMANAVERVIASESLRKGMAERGRKRFRDFSPEECAKKTAQIYTLAVTEFDRQAGYTGGGVYNCRIVLSRAPSRAEAA